MNSVLIVDSDGKALTVMQRRLRKNFETHIALGPRLGLQRIAEEGPYAVILAEFSMPRWTASNSWPGPGNCARRALACWSAKRPLMRRR